MTVEGNDVNHRGPSTGRAATRSRRRSRRRIRSAAGPGVRMLSRIVACNRVTFLTVGICASCSRSALPGAGPASETFVPVVLDFSVGRSGGNPDSNDLASVLDIYIARNGTLWVLDGMQKSGGISEPRLAAFDTVGRFVIQIGREGVGPGEFSSPTGIAELQDGRLVVRDVSLPGRITIFRPDGGLSESWIPSPRAVWPLGGGSPIELDRRGEICLPSIGRPSRMARQIVFQCYSADGRFSGEVPVPPLPELQPQRLTLTLPSSKGAAASISWQLPFQPEPYWAWSERGYFAIGLSYESRVRLVAFEPSSARQTLAFDPVDRRRSGPREIELKTERIAVSEAERADRRRALRAEVSSFPSGDALTIPAIAPTKQIIRAVGISEDDRVMVLLSAASVRVDGAWAEPEVYDVFLRDGKMLGRLKFPMGFHLMRLLGARACGVSKSDDGLEEVQCFRIGGAFSDSP